MSRTDEIMIELEELRHENERQKKMINGLKLNNSKLTLERNELIDENTSLKNELNTIKNMNMYEFANTYCSEEQNIEAGHALARALGVGR